jgi:hypothetical protein
MDCDLEINGLPCRLTTHHAASSYGQPVLVDGSGHAYCTADVVHLLGTRADDALRALQQAGCAFDVVSHKKG